jgi:hypothetical protein
MVGLPDLDGADLASCRYKDGADLVRRVDGAGLWIHSPSVFSLAFTVTVAQPDSRQASGLMVAFWPD